MEDYHIPSWITVLHEIAQGNTITDIYKKSNISYSHTIKIVRSFQRDGLLDITATGRRSIVNLTEKGLRLQYFIDNILKVIKE